MNEGVAGSAGGIPVSKTTLPRFARYHLLIPPSRIHARGGIHATRLTHSNASNEKKIKDGVTLRCGNASRNIRTEPRSDYLLLGKG